MIELIVFAVVLGFILSLVLIGPVFFLLIETSLRKGTKAAIYLDIGVLIGDVLCIIIALLFSKTLYKFIQENTYLFKIGGGLFFLYGLYLIFAKSKMEKVNTTTHNGFFNLVSQGFLLNVVNLGVWFFWVIVVLACYNNYESFYKIVLFLSIVILTFIGIDLSKIYLAKKLKSKINDKNMRFIKKITGIILVLFGLVVFYKSTQKIENKEQQELYQQLTK